MHRLSWLIAVVAICATNSRVVAQVDGTWTASDGSWSNGANWSSNPQYPNSGGVATFNITTPGHTVNFGSYPYVSVDTDVTLSKIYFGAGAYLPFVSATTGHSITLTGPAEVNVSRSFTENRGLIWLVSAALDGVAGTSGLTKTGAGRLELGLNSYVGDTYVYGGSVIADYSTSFGAAGNRLHLYDSSLEVDSNSLPTEIDLATGTGTVNLNSSTSAITGQISGPGNLRFEPTYGFGAALNLSASNTYTGQTQLFATARGTLSLSGPNGSIRNSSDVIIRAGTLVLDNTAGANGDRVGDSTPVSIASGQLLMRGNATISLNERIGTFTTEGGAVLTMAQTGSASSTLSSPALVRKDRGTVRFSLAPRTGVSFDAAPGLVGGDGLSGFNKGIIPFATSGASSATGFVTYSAVGIAPLTNAQYFAGLAGAAPDYNVSINSAGSFNGMTTVNSLRLVATLTGSGTVNVNSGAVILSDNPVSPNLNFGAAEGLIGGTGTINGTISGSNGLTLHDGTLTLKGVSTYTGTTTIQNGSIVIAGNLIAGVPGALGIDTSAIELYPAGTLAISGSGSIATLARDVRTHGDLARLAFATSQITAPSASIFNVTNNLDVSGCLVLKLPSGGTIDVSGDVSGAGIVTSPSSGTLIYSGNNSFPNGIIVESSAVLAGSEHAFGTGSVQMAGGSIGAFGAPRTIDNDVIGVDGINFAPGPKLTINGMTDFGVELLASALTVTVDTGTDVVLAGPVASAAFELNAAHTTSTGTLHFTHANPGLNGGIYVYGGTLYATGPDSLGTTCVPIGVLSGASLYVDGNVTTTGAATFSGTGVNATSALRSLSGNNAITGPVTIAAPSSIAVDSGSLALPNLVTPADSTSAAPALTKLGGGALIVPRFTMNSLSISAGTVDVIAHGATPTACAVQTISLSGGFASPTSTLDLENNGLRVDNAAIPLADISAAIRNAWHGGAWDLPGLSSSSARASHVTTLGTMSTADFVSMYGSAATFEGLSTTGSATLIKYTYYGDANFNGKVDGGDYSRIDTTFGLESSQGNIGGWINGDFDYNGKVDGGDYALIDLAFARQSEVLERALAFVDGQDADRATMTGGPLQTILGHFDQFGSLYASTFITAVPEPASGLVALATMGFLARRRRH